MWPAQYLIIRHSKYLFNNSIYVGSGQKCFLPKTNNQISLLWPINSVAVKMIIDTVMTWLNVMRVEYELNMEEGMFRTEWVMDDFKFEVMLLCTPDGWIKIRALLLKVDDIPPLVKEALYAEILKENFYREEVSYSMDNSENIYAQNDVPEYANLGTFLTELNAVVYAVKHFHNNIAPIFGLKKYIQVNMIKT